LLPFVFVLVQEQDVLQLQQRLSEISSPLSFSQLQPNSQAELEEGAQQQQQQQEVALTDTQLQHEQSQQQQQQRPWLENQSKQHPGPDKQQQQQHPPPGRTAAEAEAAEAGAAEAANEAAEAPPSGLVVGELSWLNIAQLNWRLCVAVFMVYCVTLSIFPGFLAGEHCVLRRLSENVETCILQPAAQRPCSWQAVVMHVNAASFSSAHAGRNS
jgi:hypothetical protein